MDLFEWNPVKDEENRRKHGVGFSEAQLAFLDVRRVIARDLGHGRDEIRFYCFGKVAGRVMTVRFTMRGVTVRILGAGYWRKGRRIYEANQGLHG